MLQYNFAIKNSWQYFYFSILTTFHNLHIKTNITLFMSCTKIIISLWEHRPPTRDPSICSFSCNFSNTIYHILAHFFSEDTQNKKAFLTWKSYTYSLLEMATVISRWLQYYNSLLCTISYKWPLQYSQHTNTQQVWYSKAVEITTTCTKSRKD